MLYAEEDEEERSPEPQDSKDYADLAKQKTPQLSPDLSGCGRRRLTSCDDDLSECSPARLEDYTILELLWRQLRLESMRAFENHNRKLRQLENRILILSSEELRIPLCFYDTTIFC